MSSLNQIILLILVKIFYANCEEFCFAKITISNKFDDSFQNLFLSGLYAFNSLTNQIEGQLVLTKSYSSENKSQINSNGCTRYLNEPITYSYISLIEQGECDFDDQIEYATQSNAMGLIVISKNSQIFKIKNSKNNPLVVVMISREMGEKLKTLIESSDIFVSIKPKNCESRDFYIESEFNYQRLSYVSIMFIVIGNLCLLLLLGGTCTVFYVVQKTRLIEERERMERLIDRLTKKAISKMKCKKLRSNDTELNDMCVICMENYKTNDVIRILPCSHVFHRDEIDQWMNENKTCPVCKIDILRYYGIEIEARNNIVFSILQRLRIIRSNQEITEAILAHQNSRRDTVFSINGGMSRHSIFSTGLPLNNELTINSVEQRNFVYAEFQRNHLKSFDEIEDGKEANMGRRLTFFGEKLPQIEAFENQKIQIIIQDDNRAQSSNEEANEKKEICEPNQINDETNSNVNSNHKNDTDIHIKL